jgi:UDP-GlcNAc:undecaprenyl-phosphate/decaprenyl-phosphate GlcNAc-1-phosphate transferase
MGFVVAFAAAFVVALALTPVARRVSFALGVLDHPGPLKTQRESVAYLGGVAVFAAVGVVLAVKQPLWLVPLALAVALGVADDIRTIAPPVRLAMQITIGCIAGLVEATPGRVGVIGTAALVVVLVNAVNLIDGMDGLATIVVAVSAVGFAATGGDAAVPALAVCGALVGFFVFNRPPARIYLGDGGSYLLGTVLALLAARSLSGQSRAAWIALPLLVAVPLADTAVAVLRRKLAGRPVLAGDRSHVYDQLVDRGWPIVRVLLLCGLVQVAATGAGLLSWHLQAPGAATVFVVCAIAAGIVVWRSGFAAERAPT